MAPAGHVLDAALSVAMDMAAHRVPALVANKALLRHGWAEQVVEVWEREKAAMADMAGQLGPIGWGQAAAGS